MIVYYIIFLTIFPRYETELANTTFNFFREDQFERQLRLFINNSEKPCDNLYRMVCPIKMKPEDSLIQQSTLALGGIVLSAAHAAPNPILWQAEVHSWSNNSFEDHFDYAQQAEMRCRSMQNSSNCLDDEFAFAKIIAKYAMTAKFSFFKFNSISEQKTYARQIAELENVPYVANNDYKIAMIGVFTKQVNEVPVQVMYQFIRHLIVQIMIHRYTLINREISNKTNHESRVDMMKKIVQEYRNKLLRDTALTPEHRKVALERLEHVAIHQAMDHNNETVKILQDKLALYTSSYYRALPSTNVTLFDVKRSHAFALSQVLPDDASSLVLLHEVIGVLNFMAVAVTHKDISIGSVIVLASSYNVPSASMYGMLGSVIGHELTHVVSDKNETEFQPELKRRLECLMKHYEKKCKMFPEIESCNGNLTYFEDMADFEGLQTSFNVFKKEYEEKFKIKPYKGISFTHEQLFFISWAQLWCQREGFENDTEHTPNFGRVNFALSQQPAFRKAFGCMATDRMGIDETKQCRLLDL